MLLEHGADPALKSNVGESSLDWARRAASPTALTLLKSPPPAKTGQERSSTNAWELRPAFQRSMALIEKGSWQFFVASGCVSCHAQSMTDMVAGVARSKGLSIDENAFRERVKMLQAIYPTEPLLERMDPPGAEEQLAYPLAGLALNRYPPDRMTDAMVANIAATQGADGSFHVGAAARPPAEEGDIFRTALCLFALKSYAPPGRAIEMQNRIAKARRWLERAKATTAEDRSMQLLGLGWAGADRRTLQRLASGILRQQMGNGGWSPREGLPADAYATGESLYAVTAAGGVPAKDPAYQRGVGFLMKTRHDDGSWHVISRSPRIQAYFEGGFPYGHDQWISQWGTSWAAMAIAQAVDAPVTRASQ
jgi:hypothetical protein